MESSAQDSCIVDNFLLVFSCFFCITFLLLFSYWFFQRRIACPFTVLGIFHLTQRSDIHHLQLSGKDTSEQKYDKIHHSPSILCNSKESIYMGVDISIPLISHIKVHVLGYYRKRLERLSWCRMTPRIQKWRFAFCRCVIQVPIENLVYIETNNSKDIARQYGHAEKGSVVLHYTQALEPKRYSLITCMG